MPGYVFLHRDIDRHWVWSDGRTAHRWMDLIIQAAWENKTTFFGGVRIELKRGQLVTTTRLLMARWRTNPKMVLKVLDMFEKDKMIRCKKLSDMTIITICNFDAYQSNVNTSFDQESYRVFSAEIEGAGKHERKRQRKQTKENNKEQENKKSKTTTVVESAPTHEEVFEDFFNAQIAVETFCKNESIDLETCKQLAQEVLNDWVLRDEVHHTLRDGREHLLNQLRIKISIYKLEQKRKHDDSEKKGTGSRKQDSRGMESGSGGGPETNPLAGVKHYTANLTRD